MPYQELREHQLRALKALKLFDRICEEEGLRYFMIAGSALGAVRHKGFIPWDDDVDVVLTMYQYQRFLQIAPQMIKSPYRWRHTSVDDNYPTLSGGIYYGDDEPLITVFPLVKLSDNPLERKWQWLIRKVFSPVWQRKVGYHVPKTKINAKQRLSIVASTMIACLFPKQVVLAILRHNEIKYEKRNVTWYCNIYSKYTQEKESIRTDWVNSLIRIPFEDGEFPVVRDYDAYLTHLYGDYMTPPSEKDRHPEHL